MTPLDTFIEEQKKDLINNLRVFPIHEKDKDSATVVEELLKKILDKELGATILDTIKFAREQTKVGPKPTLLIERPELTETYVEKSIGAVKNIGFNEAVQNIQTKWDELVKERE